MVLSSLGGWKGWDGFLGDLLRHCCGQGDVLCVAARRRLEQKGFAFWSLLVACLESQGGPEHRFLGGLSVRLKFDSFSGVVDNCMDPSGLVSAGVGYEVDGGYVVDGLRERRQR